MAGRAKSVFTKPKTQEAVRAIKVEKPAVEKMVEE